MMPLRRTQLRRTRPRRSLLSGALVTVGVGLGVGLGLAACGSESSEPLPTSNGQGPAAFDPGETYAPEVTGSTLTDAITNSFYPAPVGARWVYEAHTDEGVERDEVTVTADQRSVWGTAARVVRDTVYLDGVMVEDTLDWYGQDPEGNVWYLGEDTAEYENGAVTTRAGSWESGVNGALPGIVMLASPDVGHVYRQEYLAGEAEDLAQVVSINESVTVPAGSFSGCLKTRDRSAIDPEIDEFKYYCPGIGVTLEEEGDTRVELLEYSGL